MMNPRKRISLEFVFGVQKSFKVILCFVLAMTLFFDTTTLSAASEMLGLRQEAAQVGGGGADLVKPPVETSENPQDPLSGTKPEASPEAKPAEIPAVSVETPAVKPDPTLKDLSGSLEVLVTFDTVSATDAVALQLQCATRTWNADTKSWNAWGGRWTDRGAPVILNAETIKAHAGGMPGTNAFARTGAQPVKPTPATMIKPASVSEAFLADPSPAYTFDNLPVQTVTKAHDATTQPAFETQTRYRVIETSIGNDTVAYERDLNTTSKPQYRGTIEAVAAVEAVPVEGEAEAGFAPGGDQPKAESTPVQRGYVVVVANGQGLTPDAMATVDDIAALTQKATIRNDEIFPAGSAAPPQVKTTEPTVNVAGTYTYTVTTKAFNNPGSYSYTLDAPAKVTIDGKENTYAAHTAFALSIPADVNDKTITIAADVSPLEMTLLADKYPNPGIASVMPVAKKATLTTSAATTTFVVQRPAAEKTLIKNWNDNNNALSKRPAAADFQANLSLEYSTNPADPWIPLTEDNGAQLGYSALPLIPSAIEVSYSTWKYTFANTLNLFNDKGEKVTYRLAESVPDGYISSYTGEDNTLTNTALNPFVATKKWADAANAYHTRISPAQWIACVNGSGEATRGVHRVIEGVTPSQDVPIMLTTTDRFAEGYVEVVENGADWTITLPNAKGYDPEEHPYVYSLVEPAEVAVNTAPPAPEAPHDKSRYKPSYLNEGNHATETDKLYTGGTLTDTLTQPFTFVGTKVWADEADAATASARPDCTLVLYRYPANGKHDYTTASPVPTANRKLDKTVSNEDVKFPTDQNEILPMYDIDGNAYVYFVKELMSGGSDVYEKSFQQADGYKGVPGNSEFLFNGGTLTNRRAEKTDLKATKTWKSAARPDVKAQVAMTLTREKVVFENGAPKKDASGNYVYQPDMIPGAPGAPDKPWAKLETLDGFSAEQLSRTTTFNAQDKFDERGLPYRYSVSETGVKTQVGANWEPAKEITVGAASYFVTADGYRYHKEALPLNDKNEATVTNTLVGNAEVKIDKTFPEGIIGGTTEVTYTVLRDGMSIGTKTVNYHPADPKYIYLDEKHPGQPYAEQTIIKSYADFTPFSVATGELPCYAPDGHEYRYTVEETNYDHRYFPTATVSSADALYDPTNPNYPGEHYLISTTAISNPIAKAGSSILVKKQWIDDNDLMCRGTVVMGLWDNTKPAGQEIVATGSIGFGQDRVAIAVPKEYLKSDGTYQGGLKVVEVSVADTAGERTVFQDGSKIDTASLPADLHPQRPVSSDHNKDKAWVRTLNHEYDVSVAAPAQNESAWVVTNRRLGTVDVNLTKNWVDGSNQGSTRPSSVLFTVSCDKEVVFPEDPLPKFSQTYTLTAQTDGDKRNPDSWYKLIENLPKYGRSGEVLHYTVTQGAVGGDYVQTSERKPYAVGSHHTKDTDAYIFTDTLSGSTKPAMNKIWKDDGITIRPDLYTLLYRRYSEKTTAASSEIKTITEKVGTYQDRNWETKRITNDWWTCEYAPMPTYTNQGYKYEYFISEVVDVPGDYGYKAYYARPPEQPSGVSHPTADQLFPETFNKDNKPEGTSALIKLTEGDAEVAVLPAGGTVVNKLAATRSISGEKIWKNTPEGAGKNWLPEITLKLSYEGSGYETSKALTDTGLRAFITNGAAKFEFMTEDPTPVPRQVPKYNNSGQALVYHVEEVLGSNLGDCYGTESDGFGFSLTNTFKTNQNYKVTFDKTWADVPSGLVTPNQQPRITATLVRYMKIPAAAAYDETTREEIGTKILLTRNGGASFSQAVWSDLAYYAPSGVPYQYRVEESALKGYEPTTPAAAVVAGTYTPAAGSVPASGTGNAAMTNKYTGGPFVNLNVTKQWEGDTGYNISSRPAAVKAQLYRKTADGAFGEAPVGQPLTLNKDTQPRAWSATVSNLERYAPNGEPYVYSFKEEATPGNLEVPDGYASTGVSDSIVVGDATKTTFEATITNTAKQQKLMATKVWQKQTDTPLTSEELLFAYNLDALPESITYKVQYSIDGTSWSDLTSKSSGEVKQFTSTWDGSKYPSVEVSDLPAYDVVTSKAVTYRAVEVSETFKGNPASVTLRCSNPAAQYGVGTTIGAATVKATLDTNATTGAITSTISNTLSMKQITIQKTWVDEYNRDGLRKDLTFDVTRTKCNNNNNPGDFVTASVTLPVDGTGWTAGTGADAGNVWSKTLGVPLYWNNATTTTDNDKSLYSVSETPIDTYTVDPAAVSPATKSLIDLGVSTTEAKFTNAHAHETITLEAKKTWNTTAESGVSYRGALKDFSGANYRPSSLTFKLQYCVLTASGGEGVWYDVSGDVTAQKTPKNPQGADIPLEKTMNLDPITGAVQDPQNLTWNDVPRYVRDQSITTREVYAYRIVEKSVPNGFVEPPNSSVVKGDTAKPDVSTPGDTANPLTVTNRLEPKTFTLTKTWEDSSNLYQTRPDAVKYELYWKTVGSGWTIVPDKSEWNGGEQTFLLSKPTSASDSWQTTIANLPKYDGAGQEYFYQAKEVALVYGSTEIAIDTADKSNPYTVNAMEGAAFTNTVIPSDPANIAVTKVWNDNKNQDGKRPDSVQVTLQHRAKTPTGVWADIETQQLDSVNSWKYEWKNVPKYAVVSGAPVEQEYRVVEKTGAVPKEYTVDSNETNTPAATPLVSNFTITNSYTPKTMSVSANKVWVDDSNFYSKRPTNLTFTLQYTTATAPAEKDWQAIPKEQLFGNNEADRTVEVSDSGVLTPPQWNNLPVNVNPGGTSVATGETKNVKYRVIEAAVDGYAQAYDPAVINGDLAQTNNDKTISVKNTLEKKGTYSGKKIWKDEGNKYGYRPALDAYRPNVALYLNKPAPDPWKKKLASPDGVFAWDAPANSNEWTYTIANVPEPAAGTFYTVEENPIPVNYAANPSTGVVEVGATASVFEDLTNALNTEQLTVEKKWEGDGNYTNLRPANIVVEILQRKVTVPESTWEPLKDSAKKPVTVSLEPGTDNTWAPVTITGLPSKTIDGKTDYEYCAKEKSFNGDAIARQAGAELAPDTIGAYSIGTEATADGKTTITNTLDTGGLDVAKTWIDDENRDNKRPSELKITASTEAGGSTITLDGFIPSVTLNKGNTWAYDWGQVPLRDGQGRLITYTLTEPATTGYSSQYEIGTGLLVDGSRASTEITKDKKAQVAFTNTYTPETLAKTVVKQWNDNFDALGLRPSSLKVTLWATYNNGTSDVKEIAGENTFISQTGDTWTYEFKNLPKYKTGFTGKEISYSVEEEAVAGYTLTYVGTDKLNMMNTIDTTQVQAEKTWHDESNARNSRLPATIQLYQSLDNGATWKACGKSKNLDLTVSKSETISFTGLPVSAKNAQGIPSTYQYKVEESALDNYATSVSVPVVAVKDGIETITITNTAHEITLAKTDEAGTALAGATFELSGVFSDTPSGQTATKTLLSGTAERETLIGKLVAGQTYNLVEEVAPDGQKRMPGVVTIVTGENGELSLGATTPAYVTLDAAKRLITVADPPIAITIEKTAREDGRPLADCYFDLTGLFVGETAERTMNGTGETLTAQIRGKLRASNMAAVQKATVVDTQSSAVQAAGVYVYAIKETAEPAGYQIEPKPIHFVVDDQGIVSVLDDEGTITTVADGGLTLKFSDPAISVGFVKKNAAGTSLDNAVLTLSGRFADGSTIKTITSSATQAIRLDAQLIASQQYSLAEARAPQGYVKLAQPVTFTVDKVGKVTLTGNPEGVASLDATRTQVTVVNQVAPDLPGGAARLAQTGDKANAVLLPLIAVGATAALVGAKGAKCKRRIKR